ncbi:hypothetical protein HanIR_Chr14g0710091 [Helianthus annuus]|nr:hypothetical protein HanIR_Chr14g0710091 [Helianthus annuus]
MVAFSGRRAFTPVIRYFLRVTRTRQKWKQKKMEMAGQRLEIYEVIEQLGRGAFLQFLGSVCFSD